MLFFNTYSFIIFFIYSIYFLPIKNTIIYYFKWIFFYCQTKFNFKYAPKNIGKANGTKVTRRTALTELPT